MSSEKKWVEGGRGRVSGVEGLLFLKLNKWIFYFVAYEYTPQT
jgi:hypothetical protein